MNTTETITINKAGRDAIVERLGMANEIHFEGLVSAWANKIIGECAQGEWEYRTASNGAWFMVPPCRHGETLTAESLGWQCDVEISREGAGMAITMFGVGHMLELAYKQGHEWVDGPEGETNLVNRLSNNYDAVRDVAYSTLSEDDQTAFFRITD